jgi:uncharacterized protein (TIGR02246 family)
MDDYDRERELEKIDALHARDMAASKAGDFATLRSIMSDDAVILPPGGKIVRGRDELDASFGALRNAYSQIDILDYTLDFHEVELAGDYAFEWGYIRGSMRVAGGEVEHSVYQVMRILRRQPDGDWKVHRSIWNESKEQGDRG